MTFDSIKHSALALGGLASSAIVGALHGFDSFEGLPERWNADHAKGHFSTAGQIPEIADNRVTFFKGWFKEILREYAPPAHLERGVPPHRLTDFPVR